MSRKERTWERFDRSHARKGSLILALAGILMAFNSAVLADDPVIKVARVSLIEGEVSYQRANDSQKDWFDASLNMPLDQSDQLFSGPNGRAEIQLSGRNIIRIDRETNLRFTQFSTKAIQLALPVGTATFRIHSLDRRQFDILDARDPNPDDPVYFEVDTPTLAIVFLKEGNYRVNVGEDGRTEVIVRSGKAEVYNQEIGTVTVNKGRRMVIEGVNNYYQIARLDDKDEWDRWNDRRDDDLFARVDSYRSSQYIPVSLPGIYDLDRYGDWIHTPDYGWVWAPGYVGAGWAPYRDGYWRYYNPYGWTWISYEPWGWVPYHYGRWAYWRSRWCWVPSVSFGIGIGHGWNWSPHLVAFFGWGGGRYNRGYRDGFYDGYRRGFRDGYLGWCPLGPGEPYYGYGGRTIVNNNTTIINNPPRSVSSLRNYNQPGGISGIEGRKFDEGRVIVRNDILTSPPRGVTTNNDSGPVIVQSNDFQPTERAPARNEIVQRSQVARKIEAPVITRRQPDEMTSPARNIEGAERGPSRTIRDGVVIRDSSRQESGEKTGDASNTPPTRISDGQVQKSDRPTRYADYRPVERTTPPDWSTPRRSRESEGRDVRSREESMPSRNTDRPSRVDMPSRPTIEHRESPRQIPRESSPPREIQRNDPPPRRESMPSRSAERPPSPPPPQRNVERPSPPPSRGSEPTRSESKQERPQMPSRKPDS